MNLDFSKPRYVRWISIREHPIYTAVFPLIHRGSYDDGYLKNIDALATIIRDKIKEADIRSKRLVFSLMSSKIANREVIIPLVKKEHIQEVVMANVEEYFPMNISEHSITYSILEKINLRKRKS